MSQETKNNATEVAKVNDNFAITASTEVIANSMADEIQGLPISLPRVKLQTGGSTFFEIDTGDSDNPETTKELRVIIAVQMPAYSYFEKQFDGESRLPDCYSMDGVTGIGNPGGECSKCKFNQFKSGQNGNGKACKNKRQLFLIFENQIFPSVMLLPTGSLQNFTKYIQSQMFKARKLSNVITKITLKKATNKTGIPYSQAVFSCERMLTADEQAKVDGMNEFIKEYAKSHVPQLQDDDEIPFGEVKEVETNKQ